MTKAASSHSSQVCLLLIQPVNYKESAISEFLHDSAPVADVSVVRSQRRLNPWFSADLRITAFSLFDTQQLPRFHYCVQNGIRSPLSGPGIQVLDSNYLYANVVSGFSPAELAARGTQTAGAEHEMAIIGDRSSQTHKSSSLSVICCANKA